LLDALNG